MRSESHHRRSRRLRTRSGVLLVSLIALASCARTVTTPPVSAPDPVPPVSTPTPAPTPATPPAPPAPPTAAETGVTPGPSLLGLITPEQAERALPAFKLSCPDLVRREDVSGLTRGADWQPVCTAAAGWTGSAYQFFTTHLESAVVGNGNGFATGYFEPEIRGSRTRQPGYDTPVYAKPNDLLETNPQTGVRGRGRLDESGAFVPYFDRAQIEDGALANRGLEIAWAADPIDLFFLQIQGSGRLIQPDGSVMRIGYAGQNGREYVAIGRTMRERGIFPSGGITMQRITDWLRANPEQGRALMRENKSYIFFRELTGPGPLGSLGRAVTPRVTVAADPKYVPLGTPVVLRDMVMPDANGLWVAQDTGGAIKGANRFDTFWGAGADAARIAGGMSSNGRAFLLLPRGTVARLQNRAPAQP